MEASCWGWLLPGSTAAWFVVLNMLVCAIAVLSSRARARPLSSSSPRSGGGMIARRASSAPAALQRLLSSFIFSYPSALFYPSLHTEDIAEPSTPAPRKPSAVSYPSQPDDTAEQRTTTPRKPSAPAPHTPAAQPAPEKDNEDEDANSMSMEEAYALALAGRHRPLPTEEEARRSEVNETAEEFIAAFKDDQRQQRLNSIFNYTQMLKLRAAAFAAFRRQPAAQL
ncbi:hypothetical protein GUJ93_ZPchr0002g23964 [Zizania palustris]|uniref:DUF4408 domain-containing protein n=1 Tax=Zizania palustris TaxID=103762 RepID=A0A8J5RM83_ZIZPA|nr:hypothetical protein GUJ93_ZPchr0002g23964 [Zizania palustris]